MPGKAESFSDKTVLITGAARGIGYETALQFAQQGAQVTFTGAHQQTVNDAQTELESHGDVTGYVCDASNSEAVNLTTGNILKTKGPIDILVNSAGILHVGGFDQFSIEQIDAMIDINVKGVLYHSHAVLPTMLERGSGTIINISSGAGLSGFAQVTTYCTSKFAVVGFTEALADEVNDAGVRVFGVCPGQVKTDMQVIYSGAKVGIEPARVAERILQLSGSKPRARPGQCVTP